MIDTSDYEKYIEEINSVEDFKDYLRELTRLVLYDNMWGKHEAHERFLKNLQVMKELSGLKEAQQK